MKIVLTIIEKEQLELQHSKEHDGRVRDRIKAVLLNAEGWTQKQIAQALRMDWADVMAELGTAFRILRSQLMSHPKFSRAAQLFSAA